MIPFLVDMDRLYELFIAEWLKAHPPHGFSLKIQERVDIGDTLHFHIDLVLYEVATGAARYVLDTKYKIPKKPSNDDFNQVVTYATAQQCQEAVLVYPAPLTKPLNVRIRDIRVRSLTFSLDGDLDQAGQAFLQDLRVLA
jgi:5-methylcytosine-specific restriction enzyme subunit McrC